MNLKIIKLLILLNRYVSDTMSLVLYAEKRKMPEKAKSIFLEADAGFSEIIIPSTVLVEIAYLSEKDRIETSLNKIKEHFEKYPNYKEYPQDLNIIISAFEINDIHELHDRLIAGTARFLDIELITNDPKIISSIFVKTLWK